MKIAIDAGHGLHTLGKRCLDSIDPNETREWVLNNRIATRMEQLLSEYEDVETMRLDDVTGEVDVSINSPNKRANKANYWGADWCFSIHHNAGIYGKKGGGIVIFRYLTNNVHEKEMQAAIYEECVARGGLTGRAEPLAQKNLAMVRDTKCYSLLIEYGFMDSLTDTPVILTPEYAEAMAQGTVAAIAKQLKLKKKEEDNPMTAEEKKAFEELKAKNAKLEDRVKSLESAKEKVYHYWKELPVWAIRPLLAMHRAGFFSGETAGDLNAPRSLVRSLVSIAAAFRKLGVIDYKNIKYGEKKEDILKELGII